MRQISFRTDEGWNRHRLYRCFFIEELGRRVKSGLNILVCLTSMQPECFALSMAFRYRIQHVVRPSDLAVDGADEIDPYLNAIKEEGQLIPARR